MALLFHETAFRKERGAVRLVDREGNVLFELRGRDLRQALTSGDVDPRCWHYSLFELARRRASAEPHEAVPTPAPIEWADDEVVDLDPDVLARLHTRWN